MKNIQKIHFVGIKGVGMTPLAIIAKEAGVLVSGSDIADEFITDASLKKAGITPFVGFSPDHVGAVDVVITTGAHGGFDNEEVEAAKERNIPVMTQGEAVGVFMRGEIFGKHQTGISVFGSHGKTTTTAMIATIFRQAGFDPSYLIGTSDVPSLGESGHYGKGDYFIAEADEYATEPVHDKTPKLLWQHPKIAVCTNIELDHPDMYTSVDDLRKTYLTFVNELPDDGVLICWGDDPQVQLLLKDFKGKAITYGLTEENDYQLVDVVVGQMKTSFRIVEGTKEIGSFTIAVAGQHNALNAAAAVITGLVAEIAIERIISGISGFKGSKRRLEYVGTLSTGALFFDDYAHHPTEISASLQALKKAYPHKKLICIFQPHTYSRTKVLFKEFSESFEAADMVILTDIYASAREKADPSVKMDDLARKINENGKNVQYLRHPIDVVKYITENSFGNDTILITMGAGDIYKIAKDLDIQYG